MCKRRVHVWEALNTLSLLLCRKSPALSRIGDTNEDLEVSFLWDSSALFELLVLLAQLKGTSPAAFHEALFKELKDVVFGHIDGSL